MGSNSKQSSQKQEFIDLVIRMTKQRVNMSIEGWAGPVLEWDKALGVVLMEMIDDSCIDISNTVLTNKARPRWKYEREVRE